MTNEQEQPLNPSTQALVEKVSNHVGTALNYDQLKALVYRLHTVDKATFPRIAGILGINYRTAVKLYNQAAEETQKTPLRNVPSVDSTEDQPQEKRRGHWENIRIVPSSEIARQEMIPRPLTPGEWTRIYPPETMAEGTIIKDTIGEDGHSVSGRVTGEWLRKQFTGEGSIERRLMEVDFSTRAPLTSRIPLERIGDGQRYRRVVLPEGQT